MADFLKPRSGEDLAVALKDGLAVRVALQAQHTAQLEKVDKHGFKVADKVITDEQGPILLHLPQERKFAWVIRCQHDGCNDVRVARTSDVAGPVSVAFCLAHSGKGKGGKSAPKPLGDGGLDLSALETPSED